MRFTIVLLALAASGCASSRLGGDSNIQILNGDRLPAPQRSDLLTQARPYLIGPFDKIVINVFGVDGLADREVQTDAGGRISFPIAGIIEAAGKTPGELELLITQKLRVGGIRNPQVTVNLKETVSQVVTVDGEVKEPGLYPVVGRMTLMSAVATAKGTSEFAKLSDVVVFRTVNGQKLAALYNLKAIRQGAYGDPEIYAGDIIVVGNSESRRIFKDLVGVLPVLTAPLIVLLQRKIN